MKKHIDNILMVVAGIALVSNFVFINLIPPIYKFLVPIGFIILGIGISLFLLSVLEHRRKRTTKVICRGVYGFVRNPMYLGAIIMYFSHIFFSLCWWVAAGTLVGIVSIYITILIEEQKNINRFGEEYTHYMQNVPRINIFTGIKGYFLKQ